MSYRVYLLLVLSDDILRARLKTLGVSEYRFELKASGRAVGHDWRIFDVGGQRSLVCMLIL